MPVISWLQDIFEGSENYNHFTAKYPILDVCTVILTLQVRIMPIDFKPVIISNRLYVNDVKIINAGRDFPAAMVRML